MPRKKKDGRFINYYIDRQIFERLEQYADDKGQSMTTAIERILQEYLDLHEAENAPKGGLLMYCPKCNVLAHNRRCPICGSQNVREPNSDDYCYLTEKDAIWSGALADLLRQNSIPYVTKDILGAGLAAKIGPGLERTRFYVAYSHYESAQALEREFFSAETVIDE